MQALSMHCKLAAGVNVAALSSSCLVRPPDPSGQRLLSDTVTPVGKQAVKVAIDESREGRERDLSKGQQQEDGSERGLSSVKSAEKSDKPCNLPWAIEFQPKRRAETVRKQGVRSTEVRGKPIGQPTTERPQPASLQQLGGKANLFGPQRLSARQQLIALDREGGADVPAFSPPSSEHARRLDRRHFRRGEETQKEWRDNVRLAQRAVEAILASQGLSKTVRGATVVNLPGVGGGPGSEGQSLGSQASETSVNGASGGGEILGGERQFGRQDRVTTKECSQLNAFPNQAAGGHQNVSALTEVDTSATDAEKGVEEKKVALARTLEALGGSLSLYRWQDVLKDLGECGQWALALDIFNWAQDNLRIKPNAFTYAQMAMTLQAAGQPAPLIALYKDALRHGMSSPPEQLFNAVIFAHVQQGNLREGLEVFAQMRAAGRKPGQWTYAYLLQGCARVANPGDNPESEAGLGLLSAADLDVDAGLTESEDLDREMGSEVAIGDRLREDLEGVSDGFVLDLHKSSSEAELRGATGVGLGQRERVRIPDSSANCMERSTETTFPGNAEHRRQVSRKENGAASCSMTAEKGEQESELLGEAVLLAGGTAEPQTAVEIADDLVRGMLASGVRHSLVTLTTLAEVYARGGHVARALELFGRFSDHGVKPDAGSYLTLFHACIQGGASLRQLLEVYEGMVRGRIRPPETVYYPLLRACASEKDLKTAFQLFSEMRAFGSAPDAKHYTSLVFVCGVVGDIPRAEDALTEMLTQGLETTTITWNALLSGLRKGGSSFTQLKPVVKKMRAAGAEPDCTTYSILLQACRQEGRVNTAQNIYAAFIGGRTVPGERILVHREALEIFARAVMIEACEAVTAQMRAEGLALTRRMHELLIAAYAADLNYTAMAAALGAMLDEWLTPGVAANDHVARALARGGRVGELLVLLKTIKEVGGEVPGRMWHHVITAHVNVPDEEPDFGSLSETLLDMDRTSGPFPTAALVSVLVLISQADTWQRTQPLVFLLGRIDGSLFRAASQLLSGEQAGKEPDLLGVDNRVESEASRETVDENWSEETAERFVRLVKEAEPENTRLRLVLLGRTADALWFRGLRFTAAALVRTVLSLELNRSMHGGPIRPSESSHVAESWRLDLHRLSEGGACALLLSWLRDCQADISDAPRDPPARGGVERAGDSGGGFGDDGRPFRNERRERGGVGRVRRKRPGMAAQLQEDRTAG